MNQIYEIVLGALLHDIGKFMQRAEVDCKYKNDEDEMQRICPEYSGGFTHRHVLWTSSFLEENERFLPRASIQAENPEDNYINFARHHHKPNTPLQWMIAEADRLSSGMDRLEKDIDDEISGRGAYKKTSLKSVFEEASLGTHEDRNEYVYPLKKLSATDEDFPFKKGSQSDSLVVDYRALWDGFLNDFMKLPGRNVVQYYHVLVSLLEQYTWAIPSSTVDVPDISLFDHSITTAAIASALYQYHASMGEMDENTVRDRGTKKFLLVGGDLSGIQPYIFNLTKSNVRGVSKILRARSFYIGLLADLWCNEILEGLKLLSVNRIMNAGGRFVILAQNTGEAVATLKSIQGEVDSFFLSHFKGELVLNLSWAITPSGHDFMQERFVEIISSLSESLEEIKLRKLSSCLRSPENCRIGRDYDLYNPDTGLCTLCGKNPAVERARFSDEDEETSYICGMCDWQIQLGRFLPHTKYLGYAKKKTGAAREIPVMEDRYYISFFSDKNEIEDDRYIFIEAVEDDSSGGFARRFLANYIPKFSNADKPDLKRKGHTEEIEAGSPKTFDCIALASQKVDDKGIVRGRAMLGVLKADVDRLGFIFGIGLMDKLSVSRYTFMSRMINLYFCGYLQNLLKHNDQYRDIYTVYAGGDDLFLIGPWDQVIIFAREMQKSFCRYTCNNVDLTISAGINFIRSRYPINRAADVANRLLEAAKDFGGNRITFFNTTIAWDEVDKYINFGKFLDEKINDSQSPINPSFVYRLLTYHKMSEKVDTNIQNLKYRPLLCYDIGRNIIKKNRAGEIQNMEEVEKLQEIVELSSPLIKGLKIPISYTMYKNRR